MPITHRKLIKKNPCEIYHTHNELVKAAFDLNQARAKSLGEKGPSVLCIDDMVAHPHQHVQGVTARWDVHKISVNEPSSINTVTQQATANPNFTSFTFTKSVLLNISYNDSAGTFSYVNLSYLCVNYSTLPLLHNVRGPRGHTMI